MKMSKWSDIDGNVSNYSSSIVIKEQQIAREQQARWKFKFFVLD